MGEICSTCGLPKEICACQAIEKETVAKIKVYVTKKQFNKFVTVVEGLQGDELERTFKELKRSLACGGSSKNNVIILQGSHREKVAEYLMKLGYPKEVIQLA